MPKANLEVSLIDAVAGDNLKDLALDYSEIVLDSFLKNECVKDIPFFGTLYRTYRATLSIRENIFAKKVYSFLFQLKDIPQQERKAFTEKVTKDENLKYKLGETLIVLLDKLDNLNKPEIIGNLFKAVIEENLSYDLFLRLSSMVYRAFLPDIISYKQFLTEDPQQKFNQEELVNVGILKISLVEKSRNSSVLSKKNEHEKYQKIECRLTQYGALILKYGFNCNTTYVKAHLYDISHLV